MGDTKLIDVKDKLFLQYARVGKCLSSERRLEILFLLSNSPSSVENIANSTGMTVANVSRHLQVLLDANLVKFTKEGTYAIYSLANSAVADFLMSLWSVCERQLSDIARIQQDLTECYKEAETIGKAEVLKRMQEGSIVVIDVRSQKEYDYGHIEGAESVPLEEMERFLDQLPAGTEVAVYCRGPFCSSTSQAVQMLLDHGFKAYRIEEDAQRWKTSNKA
ncbi:ArsR/SmtB family transcription factor [Paenibacillus sp. CN-4]|uniref:ArsR/SmtB family transcription factor n=1 Tax=Paenibacillus nanchangensis TaxID=3348343 RepID=UPI00397B794F